MMKTKHIFCLCVLALSLNSCWTRIWTVAPTTEYVAPVQTVYSTRVTTSAPRRTTTTTVSVTAFNNDRSFYLDLRAVAAAFADSRNIQEFEQRLNSSRYMISNLDLNNDGFLDFLRVLETWQGTYHVFLIQACLSPSVYQDVATLVAERQPNALYVEVIGDPYLYGRNYIVRPVFSVRPPMWDVFGRKNYSAWHSPYGYGSWPQYFKQPKPVYLSHYQAYVNAYMTNHHYCGSYNYPTSIHYNNYSNMTQPNARHDYSVAHPTESFEHRVTQTLPSTYQGQMYNAGQLRTETERQQAAQPAQTTQSSRTSQTSQSTRTGQSTQATQSSQSSRTSQTNQSSRSSQAVQTTVDTRVNKDGSSRTTVRSTDATGTTTTTRRNTSTGSTSTSSRSSGTSTSTRSSDNSTSTRSSGNSGSVRR